MGWSPNSPTLNGNVKILRDLWRLKFLHRGNLPPLNLKREPTMYETKVVMKASENFASVETNQFLKCLLNCSFKGFI